MEAHIKKMIQLQKNPIPLSSGDDQENETSPAGRGIGSVNFRPILGLRAEGWVRVRAKRKGTAIREPTRSEGVEWNWESPT
jgi:hypothetical protein